MTYSQSSPDNDHTKAIRKMNHVVELARRKHMLLTALKGISVYAHEARQFTLTDREIDRFTIEMLDIAVSDKPMGLDHIRELLDSAEEMRIRSKKLYHWACEIFSKTPKPMNNKAEQRNIDPRHVLYHSIRQLDKATGETPLLCRERLYWEGVCAQKLNKLGVLAVFQLESGTLSQDICGLIHEILGLMTKKLNIFELIELSVFLDEDPLALLDERGVDKAPIPMTLREGYREKADVAAM